MTDYEPRLVHLPGTKLTPDVVLHRTLNKLDHIKAVTIVIQWNDETFSVDWSQMRASEFCAAALMIDINARAVLEGKE
jgi:hypothetical protein